MANYNDLVKTESLKKMSKIDFGQVQQLVRRAKKDLIMAKKNLSEDEPTALDLVYKSMFHAANALIQSQGYRLGKIRQHIGVITAVKRTFGQKIHPIILKFDRLRQKRNELEYQALYRGTKTEIQNSFKDAEILIEKIQNFIEEKNPQQKFHF